MIILESEERRNLFIGSAFFACGGGVPFESSIALLEQTARARAPRLASIDEFASDACFCTVYAIGATSAGASKDYRAFLVAMRHLEDAVAAPIAGVIPGEIGSEVNAVWVADQLDIPVVDTDMVGGRAVPEEQMDLFGIYGRATTPVAVANDQGDVLLVKTARDLSILETTYRAFAVASGGYCYLAGRPIQQAQAKELLPAGTVSRALRTGEHLRRCRTAGEAVTALTTTCASVLLAAGVVTANETRNDPGFLTGVLRIRGAEQFERQDFALHYKNEHVLLCRGAECLCSAPDLISVLDASTFLPIANAHIRHGQTVLVLGTPALPVWRSERGVSLCGPARFGFAHTYVPLGVHHTAPQDHAT